MIRATMKISQDGKKYYSLIKANKNGTGDQFLNGRIYVQYASYVVLGRICKHTLKSALLFESGKQYSETNYALFSGATIKDPNTFYDHELSHLAPSDKIFLKLYYTKPRNRRVYTRISQYLSEYIPYYKDKINDYQVIII